MAQQKKKKKSGEGCLWIFLAFIFTLIPFGVLQFLGTPEIVSFVLSLLIGVFITYKLLGKPLTAGIIRSLLLLLFVFYILKTIGGFFIDNVRMEYPKEEPFKIEESVTKSSIIENKDTVSVYTSNRYWRDNFGNDYSGALTIREPDYLRLKNHTATYNPPSSYNFWGDLYDYIDNKDTPSLDLVMKTFSKINKEKGLNQMEFAEMVVSCIQDIPYALVFQGECLPAHNYEESIKDVLVKCPSCCIGNIPYGVQTPVSFLQNLKGDCDTRTLLIYGILKHFNYDVAILNSEFYRHSILGLNLPSSGLYKIYRGKKYMLWETTGKHFKVGYLSPGFNDVTHWDVVLTSK